MDVNQEASTHTTSRGSRETMTADRNRTGQRRRGLGRGAAVAAIAVYIALGVLLVEPGADQRQGPDTTAQATEIEARDHRPSAPDFRLKDLAGGDVKLSDYRGHVVLLNFWATWSAPCRAEMPSMQRLRQGRRGDDFEILALSLDSALPPVTRFARQDYLGFPVLLDPGSLVASRYGVTSLPVSLLIDRQGRIATRIDGALDWDGPDASNAVAALLSE